MNNRSEKCVAPHCRNEGDIYYYKIPLCDKHWNEYSELPTDKLKKKLNIRNEEADE